MKNIECTGKSGNLRNKPWYSWILQQICEWCHMKNTVIKLSKEFSESKAYTFIVFVVVFPIMIYSMHSVPAADDFSGALDMRKLEVDYSSYFLASLVRTRGIYVTDCGFFFSSFIASYFSPLLRCGISGVRFFNTVSNLFFFVSLFV